MLLPQFQSKISDLFINVIYSLTHSYSHQRLPFHEETKLWIAAPSHRSIIEIGWSDNESSIINDHEFAVEIDDLCLNSEGLILGDAMSSEAEERQVLLGIDSSGFQSLN